jgi:hypothetical protein
MLDQNTNQEENIDNEELNTEKPPVDKAKETQTLIDNAVKTRLARERETTKALQTQWDEERQALIAENELLKKEFQSKLDQELSDIPTSFRGLISKLPIAEQIAWLTEQKKEQEAKPKPTPIPNFGHKENLDGKGEIQHMPVDRIV